MIINLLLVAVILVAGYQSFKATEQATFNEFNQRQLVIARGAVGGIELYFRNLSKAMRLLLDYDWPGNVRELENSIEHAAVLAKTGRIEASDLPAVVQTEGGLTLADTLPTIEEHERNLLLETLEQCAWVKKEAAQHLGISRTALYDKLKRYQISKPTTH